MSKCRKFEGNKCHNCGKIGHQQKNCWRRKKKKEKKKEKEKEKTGAEQVNYGEEEIAFLADEDHYSFYTFDACNIDVNDHGLIYYN